MESITGMVIADFTNPVHALNLFKILYAAVLGFIIGWERRSKHAGIRTFTLMTLGAAIFTIISVQGFPDNSAVADQARVIAQIVSGVGFIGAGIIWKNNGSLTGLTTAAGMWVAAGVGIAVGIGMFLLSTASTLLIVVIFSLKKYFIKYERGDRE